jgi:outer membrane protein OmpA-like peptidoglycan-associated protein
MFRKINLLEESFELSNALFSKALQSNREFGITIDSEIDYEFNKDKIYIFWGKGSILNQSKEPLGKGYKVALNFVKATVSAKNGWDRFQEINKSRAIYEDISADGIDSFNDQRLEDIGWNSIEFNIQYRDLVEYLEEFGKGIIVAIERHEEPYMFSGLGFMSDSDLEFNREILFDFAKSKIEEKIKAELDEYKKYGFSDEESEALEFFGISKDI